MINNSKKFKILLVYFFLLTHFNECKSRHIERSKNPKIIIVGAGASGIAAASKLLQNNFTNLVILEAENRIGGRVQTVDFGE